MTPSSHPRRLKRAPRANFRGSVAAILQLENRRKISAKVHQLSITGGLIEVSSFLDERTKVVLTIPFASGTAYPKAEMMFPMRGGAYGYLQPFRFTKVSGEDLILLDREITEFLKQSLSPFGARGLSFRPPDFQMNRF